MKKAEIVWLALHTCTAHRHSYLQHYSCFLREHPTTDERIGVLDIEATDLVADFGIMLTWCIKVVGSDEIVEGCITRADLDDAEPGREDKRITQELVTALGRFDKIIGYYSKRYDVPFIRTRALANGIEFPTYGTLTHVDLYDMVKHRLRLRRSGLVNACKAVLGTTEKTHLDGATWRLAGRGDRKALKYVLDHNRADVRDTEKLYMKMVPFVRKNDTSI